MSTTSLPSNVSDPIPLPGGIPVSSDLAPSVIFIVLYVLLIPIIIWRFVDRRSRTMILIRPAIFVTIRIVTWAMRAIEAGGNYAIGLIIAEQVLLSMSSIFLVEPIIALLMRVLERAVPYTYAPPRKPGRKPGRNDAVGILPQVLRFGLMTAISIAMYSAFRSSDAANGDQDAADTVTLLGKITSLIVMCTELVLLGSIVLTSFKYHLEIGPMLFLAGCNVGIFTASIFRVSAAFHDSWTTEAAPFYVLLGIPEIVITTAYLSINLNLVFPEPDPPSTFNKVANNSTEFHALQPKAEDFQAVQRPQWDRV